MAHEIIHQDLTHAGQFGFPGFEQFVSPASSRRYHLDDTDLISEFGSKIPAVVADLLDIAASVMWMDRRFKRPKAEGPFKARRGWSRTFDITLGVRCYDIWQNPLLRNTLEQLLFWLTEDVWHLQFKHQPVRRVSDILHPLHEAPRTDALIVLYSGGLDSLAGTIELLRTYPQHTAILLSVVPPRLRGIVNRQYALLEQHFGSQRVRLARIPFHLVNEDTSKRDPEKTQRTRGFLYFVCGLAQAVVYNAQRVFTCENGIGMLNLPLNKRQLGTHHSRSVHPRTITVLSHLLTQLGLSAIQYEAPFFSRTKGELCTVLEQMNLQHLCTTTISCDRFPIRKRKPEPTSGEWHCGYCTSCLLRRQALFAAQQQAEDAKTPYQYDVCDSSQTISLEKYEPLQMMLDQVTLFKHACSSEQPATSLLLEFPEVQTAYHAIVQQPQRFGLTNKMDHLQVIVELIRRYADEWKYFPFIITSKKL